MRGILAYADEIKKNNTASVLQRLNKLGFSHLFYVTKNYDGRVFYASQIAQTIEDRLKHICEHSIEYGIKIIVWFCLFPEGYKGKLLGFGPSEFFKNNPDCSAVNKEGKNTLEVAVECDYGLENYCCPAKPLVYDYESSLIKEILEKYADIAGVHLDFVRFPFPGDYCYCSSCRELFYSETGLDIDSVEKEQLREWQCTVVTRFVNQLVVDTKRYIQDRTLSALVWKYPDALEKTQDWKEWKLDFFTPLFYHRSYGESPEWVRNVVDANRIERIPVVAAIGGPNSDKITAKEWKQAEQAAYLGGAEGVMYGHYGLEQVLHSLECKPSLLSRLLGHK